MGARTDLEALVLRQLLDERHGRCHLGPELVHQIVQLLQGVHLKPRAVLLQQRQQARHCGSVGWGGGA